MPYMPVPITLPDMAPGSPLAAALLALNNTHAAELSWLDDAKLRQLVTASFLACRIGEADAMLLTFDQAAAYNSPNFLWFRARLPRFVYIDRIVVAQAARGRGHASRLYRHLFAQARAAGHTSLVCEVNIDPPNPGSDAFHAAFGFTEIGTVTIHGGAKTVRYLLRQLADTAAPDR